ncbi:MAG: dTMP kinase [Hyphomicrobiaceae bacterium]
MRGKFITFEGGEGSGKSTQARLLADAVRRSGQAVVETREPGGSPFAERLRSFILDPSLPPHVPLAEALLFYAARADHISAVIQPAIERGQWVICDRFSDSTRVYQGAAGSLPSSSIETLEALVVGGLPPDLSIVLDVPVDVGLARARARSGVTDGYEARGADYHRRLRTGFVELARDHPDRVALVDGTGDVGTIAIEVRRVVACRLGIDL